MKNCLKLWGINHSLTASVWKLQPFLNTSKMLATQDDSNYRSKNPPCKLWYIVEKVGICLRGSFKTTQIHNLNLKALIFS